jgi:hypothetical protein
MINERWIVDGGSIFTEKIYSLKCELSNNKVRSRKAIAFNVGREKAEHIVALHNASLEKETEDGTSTN